MENNIGTSNKRGLLPFHDTRSFLFTLDELMDSSLFNKYIIENMVARKQYCVLLKVRYLEENFCMLGSQIAFKFDNYYSFESFNNLRFEIISRLNSMMDIYGMEDSELNLIQVLYKEVYYGNLDKLKLDDIKHRVPNKEYLHIKRLSRYLPLSFDDVNMGKPLKSTKKSGIVNSVLTLTKNDSGQYIDFIKNFNNSNILTTKLPTFHQKQLFYQNNLDGNDYIIVIDKIKDYQIIKEAYSLNGVIIERVEDIKMSDNSYIRKFGNYTLLIKNNKITYVDKKIKLSAIKPVVYKDKGNIIENTRLGVIDLETYNVNSSIAKVYALGFFTNLDSEPILYYIDKENLDSNKLIITCINEMLRSKYSGITFYAHNLGKFDVVFIIKALLEYNKINDPNGLKTEEVKCNKTDKKIKDFNGYKLNIICRDDVILKLKISRIIDGVLHSINILDSYRVLTDSLKSLSVKYEVDVIKGDFPHKFANKDTLFYRGQTPNLNYYSSTLDQEQYNNMYKEVWDFKKESLFYLSKDLISLYKILVKINKTLFLDFDIDLTKCLTISKLAYEIFTKDYLDKDKPIPLINKRDIYRDIKLGYYGGMTEVYKPYGKNLYYYDVNSLYPYVALNDMPGLECHKLEYININKDIDINELFGFFYCDIELDKNNYLGILPVKTNTGNIYPVGKWSGMYFSEELKYAQENGYKISVKWGYKFNRVKHVFSDYVNKLYNMKSHPKNITQKLLAKSLLNNLLGRIGIPVRVF